MLRESSLEAVGKSVRIGVTGAQGVGKSTFCNKLHSSLLAVESRPIYLLNGLGNSIRALGFEVGSAAGGDSIAAVFAAHIKREVNAKHGLNILDRCVVDALAYVRVLQKTSPALDALYEQVSALSAASLSLVIHCEMSARFQTTLATHETDSDRAAIAREIPKIITELAIPRLCIDASSEADLERAVAAIRGL